MDGGQYEISENLIGGTSTRGDMKMMLKKRRGGWQA